MPKIENSIKELTPDFTDWTQIRINAYKKSMQKKVDAPLGMLKIEKIALQVAVFEGSNDLILNRGVGRVEKTEKIGGLGNIGIAGHRDGFFRKLGKVVKGDEIQLVTPNTTYTYLVDKILIVTPKDYYVLRNGISPQVTLVTCYPFYYKGNAPQRFIVKATLKKSELPHR